MHLNSYLFCCNIAKKTDDTIANMNDEDPVVWWDINELKNLFLAVFSVAGTRCLICLGVFFSG